MPQWVKSVHEPSGNQESFGSVDGAFIQQVDLDVFDSDLSRMQEKAKEIFQNQEDNK